MSMPEPWVDHLGMAHKPFLMISSKVSILASEVIEVLDSARDDPCAFIQVEYSDRWCADFYTLVYQTDRSDTYCI